MVALAEILPKLGVAVLLNVRMGETPAEPGVEDRNRPVVRGGIEVSVRVTTAEELMWSVIRVVLA